jgi:arylsulfatase A-like enzyme
MLGTAGVASAADNPLPNILYIMADDHAAHAISAYGSKINKTPNIDRSGNEGVRLTNCFCTNLKENPGQTAELTAPAASPSR